MYVVSIALYYSPRAGTSVSLHPRNVRAIRTNSEMIRQSKSLGMHFRSTYGKSVRSSRVIQDSSPKGDKRGGVGEGVDIASSYDGGLEVMYMESCGSGICDS